VDPHCEMREMRTIELRRGRGNELNDKQALLRLRLHDDQVAAIAAIEREEPDL
jgi:hypothetical protein